MARRHDPPPPRQNSLVASAAVMARHPEGMAAKVGRSESWQEDAWRFYDTVGELRFGIGWLANGMSRVNLVAALEPETQGDEPSAIVLPDDDLPDDLDPSDPLDVEEEVSAEDRTAVELVSAIAGGVDGQGQMLAASCVLLSIPGIGYVLMESTPVAGAMPADPDALDDDLDVSPDETWTWRVLSVDELRAQGEVYEVATGQGTWRPVADDHVLLKVWRSHPRKSWDADSPCRAVLGVLRQITLLDEHVQATATSRLAGAGLLVLPSEAEFAPMPTAPGVATPQPTDDVVEDDFTDTLVDTMTTPIGDRGTAAAVVPLTVRIPGEWCDKVQHITFWTEFNENLLPLRNSAVQRLALGLDLPPEVLTGMAGMNHWGAWQVEETAITLHIEPMAETICHALTIGYLRPALAAAGVADPDRYMVWYDTTDLTTRPDRSDDTLAAYDRLEASGMALRRESGLSEDDAPSPEEKKLRILLDVAKGAPTMAPQMLAEAGILAKRVADAAPPPDGGSGGGDADADDNGDGNAEGPPDTRDDEPALAASAAFLEACDGLVFRALERAGGRLRSAAGRRVNGGAATIDCPDPSILHTQLDATVHADLDQLLDGAWTRAHPVAARYGYDPDALASTLNAYTRALLATGHAHDRDRLCDALGLGAAV